MRRSLFKGTGGKQIKKDHGDPLREEWVPNGYVSLVEKVKERAQTLFTRADRLHATQSKMKPHDASDRANL
eukprot:6181596-Pleurochrysis_carterae.AAC.1